jgi:hypothetical protein
MCSPPTPRPPSRPAAPPEAPLPLAKALRPARARRDSGGRDTLSRLRIPVAPRPTTAGAPQ